ncbi:SAM-dependent methyltransferase [Magnetococcales bacterium HHB-1]
MTSLLATEQVDHLDAILHENHSEHILIIAGDAHPLIIELGQRDYKIDYCGMNEAQYHPVKQALTDYPHIGCHLTSWNTILKDLDHKQYDFILLHHDVLSLSANHPDITPIDHTLTIIYTLLKPGGTLLIDHAFIEMIPLKLALKERGFHGFSMISPTKNHTALLARRPLDAALDENKQTYYRKHHQIMKKVWSENNSMCWGRFPEGEEQSISLEKATDLHIQWMAERITLTPESVVLDLGCGNGYTAIWLAQTYGCRVVGLDLATSNIERARQALAQQHQSIQKAVSFVCTSMIDATFEKHTFSHIWSNAAIYHVHADQMLPLFEKLSACLKPGGIIIYDTLVSPTGLLDDHVREWVCDRFHLETLHTRQAYMDAMKQNHIEMDAWEDLTKHLRITYERVSQKAQAANYPRLSTAYAESAKTTERNMLSWIMIQATKAISP